MDEFELITRFFTCNEVARSDVVAGVGDDAALLTVPAGCTLAVAVDTIVADVHFPAGTPAEAIAHRALAVNLSDLAAMGAEPAWALLSLTLPQADQDWLRAFSQGFFALAERTGIALVGGDVTRGPLSVSVTAHGFVQSHQALRRAGARPDDRIYVTGTLGDAAAGLAQIQAGATGADDVLVQRFYYPEPRIAVGRALVGLASAAIDISDGLLADISHIARASGCAASIEGARVPLSDSLKQARPRTEAQQLALTGGDDYELCFTVSADQASRAEQAVAVSGGRATCIGTIGLGNGVVCIDNNGNTQRYSKPAGYQHFGA